MRVFTVDEVAQVLDLHPKTVRRHIREGRLPAARVGGEWRVREEDLGAFLGTHPARIEQRLEADVAAFARGEQGVAGEPEACVIVRVPAGDAARAAAVQGVFLERMNADDPDRGPARFQCVYDAGEAFARYVLWGRPGFLARVLDGVERATTEPPTPGSPSPPEGPDRVPREGPLR